ncbi:MAG TPA: hypothetical protein VGD41_10685, partial [Pyrinomonadaceae bacterium]
MQTKRNIEETGNVLLCVLGVILVVSLLGATVLQNSTTRLNVSTNQVRAWKDALSAAESGGDVGLAEIRKTVTGSAKQWAAADGWSPIANGYAKETVIPGSTLRANTVVEKGYFNVAGVFTFGTNPTGNSWYRIRSKGIAPLQGLRRTGMDDALISDG